MRALLARLLTLVLTMTTASACYSGGLYGYTRTYEPLSEEEDAVENALEYDPVMAKRQPDQWRNKVVTLFGVVQSRNEGPGGTARVSLSARALEPRNLCDSADEETCRVTVSDRQHALVHALLKLRTEDAIGPNSVGPRSLVRIVGKLADEIDPADGAPVIVASYYRHWPRDYYVTTSARSYMRR